MFQIFVYNWKKCFCKSCTASYFMSGDSQCLLHICLRSL